jgi:pimeloyl-ACP methyl ester carboxylesterase
MNVVRFRLWLAADGSMPRSGLMDLTLARRCAIALSLALALLPCTALAQVAEHRLPLDGGHLAAQRLLDTIGIDAGVPRTAAPAAAKINLAGQAGERFLRDLRGTLGPACEATLDGDALVVRLDRKTARTDPLTLGRTVRLLTTGRATRPVEAGARFGLTLPAKFDPAKPVVVLIHGIDSDNEMWGSLVATMATDGVQYAFFRYDDNAPLAGGGQLLGDCLSDLLLEYPKLKLHVLGHSMGGLVARYFIEGPCYHGGVDRLFLVGTPNHGSSWAHWRWALEVYQKCYEGKRDPTFSWERLRKEGNGPAARDMQPDSEFLRQLNSRQRRQEVRYTVIAGDQSTVRNIAAGWVDQAAGAVPAGARQWWGIRQARAAIEQKAQELRAKPADCDGPVSVESAKLEGTKDYILLHTDHMGMVCGSPPAAWAMIKDRLGQK